MYNLVMVPLLPLVKVALGIGLLDGPLDMIKVSRRHNDDDDDDGGGATTTTTTTPSRRARPTRAGTSRRVIRIQLCKDPTTDNLRTATTEQQNNNKSKKNAAATTTTMTTT